MGSLGHGGRVLTAEPIIAIGFLFLLWFAGAIANLLRESGQGRLAATVWRSPEQRSESRTSSKR